MTVSLSLVTHRAADRSILGFGACSEALELRPEQVAG